MEAFHLHRKDGKNTNSHKVSELKSPQEETDTLKILYCMYGKQKGYKNISIKTLDSGIFFICLHYAHSFLQGWNPPFSEGTFLFLKQIKNVTPLFLTVIQIVACKLYKAL